MTRAEALLFGLNYQHIPSARLYGCHKDTALMSELLSKYLKPLRLTVYNDNTNLQKTSYNGIINEIISLANRAKTDKLDLVFIHYSGHGSYMNDTNNDEMDKQDEVICPSDFKIMGMISDDTISKMLAMFPSSTKVITFFDSCHSGTITDLRYEWIGNTPKNIIQGGVSDNVISAKVLSMSGCTDIQTAQDTAFGGMLTTSTVRVVNRNPSLLKNVFLLQKEVNASMQTFGAIQRSLLTSSYDLRSDPTFL